MLKGEKENKKKKEHMSGNETVIPEEKTSAMTRELVLFCPRRTDSCLVATQQP